MNNEKQCKVLLESYQKAYPDVLKQNQSKAAQREWNRVKNSGRLQNQIKGGKTEA